LITCREFVDMAPALSGRSLGAAILGRSIPNGVSDEAKGDYPKIAVPTSKAAEY